MPLFKYVCRNCEAENEILIRASETPTCPECDSTKLNKQLSAFAPVSGASNEPMGCGMESCPQFANGGCMN